MAPNQMHAEPASVQREERGVQEPEHFEVEPGVDVDGEALSVVEAEAAEAAADLSVTSFKCAGCGLSHGHATDKHRASDSFDMSHEEAGTEMGTNPNCHCGANELAARNVPGAESTASSAPVPEHVNAALGR